RRGPAAEGRSARAAAGDAQAPREKTREARRRRHIRYAELMRRLACLLAFAGCADILGIRDPVLPESGDASPVDAPGGLDGPPSAIDGPPVRDARMGPDANTCTWPYEPIDFNPCSLPADNGDLTLNGGTIEIDTDTIHTGAGDISLTNRQTQAQPGASCPLKLYVFLTGTLSGTINVRGTCPAALIFLGDVTIAGGATLDPSAEAPAGAGGNDATAGGTATGTKGGDVTAALSAAGGGGGGGHGATGGMGAAGGGTAGGGGGAFGETAAEPPGLHGGCAGGEGGNGNLSGGGSGGGGAPGDGGGALQMSSKGTIRVNGTARLRANGGGGQGAQLLGGLLEATGGGGGGSGGTILLEAALVDFLPTANKPTLCATGGGGGEG